MSADFKIDNRDKKCNEKVLQPGINCQQQKVHWISSRVDALEILQDIFMKRH